MTADVKGLLGVAAIATGVASACTLGAAGLLEPSAGGSGGVSQGGMSQGGSAQGGMGNAGMGGSGASGGVAGAGGGPLSSLGTPCQSGGECQSGICADGVCCNAPCDGPCRSCLGSETLLGDGTCDDVARGRPGGCGAVQACDGEGDCKLVDGQPCQNTDALCVSGFCVDGVCCDSACNGTCRACINASTTQADGQCANIPFGQDPDNECPGANDCNGNGSC